VEGVRSTTAMHSPIIYNRRNEPVDGGKNVATKVLHCLTCNQSWTCKQTELEELQGELPKWQSSKKA
jgi:hypothetical protein